MEVLAPDSIFIKNARVNNLKNVTLHIPRNELVVVTGVSGSGKSSLAFDTLYAEGQRRYVESLSSYARQFLARMEKPEVDYIQGISPAMAIQQQVSTSNPRATVGTVTEIYDFLKLLFARTGRTFSPVSGVEVTRDSVSSVVDFVLDQADGSRVQVMTEVHVRSRGYRAELEITLQKGFTRIRESGLTLNIEEELERDELPERKTFTLLIDRLIVRDDDRPNLRGRLGDSVQTAYQEGMGECWVQIGEDEPRHFSERFEVDGITFEQPSVNLFSFNNPYGACSTCEGFGRVMGIDENLVIPDKTVSIYAGAVAPWRGETMSRYQRKWIEAASERDFPIHRPYYDLTSAERKLLWEGFPGTMGINGFFDFLRSKTHKVQYRVMLARYRGYTTCPDCEGSRLRKDARYVKVGGRNIAELLMLEIENLQGTLDEMETQLEGAAADIGKRLFVEMRRRLGYLIRVGVGYLTLNRKINTLSGGEMQRIRLATSLGSGLVGSMYILDEPSIGLHPRDTDKLIAVLEGLRGQGNTVIVVEHDESIMRSADRLIDIGPGAGENGGEVVFNGTFAEMMETDTLTARYLRGSEEIALPEYRRKVHNKIHLEGAHLHNLKGIDVDIPLHALTVVTGVSGSGKTSLVTEVLYPNLQRHLNGQPGKGLHLKALSGDLSLVNAIEMVDQRAIGRSARSNPATYIKAFDAIRELFARQNLAKIKGLKAGHFSFNIDGGRCDACKGDGYVVVEMQFLPDVRLTCEVCGGKQFKRHVLEVRYKEKNIHEVLNLTVSEALVFFGEEKKIASKLGILDKVGLGYVRLGQSTSTLSGGEAQRMKLASFLANSGTNQGTFYIFDEPTTGLHFDDIKKLLVALNELVERGNTVLVIEHNLDVIKAADWIVDLGPEGGSAGGNLVFQGRPEALVEVKESYTAKYLGEKLA